MRRRAREAGRAIALPAAPCPRAGGSRGSRAGRRPVPQGRAAPLTRGHAGPYQRPPPTRPRYAQHGRAIPLATGRVATTARIRRTVYGPRGGVEGARPWAPGTGVPAGRHMRFTVGRLPGGVAGRGRRWSERHRTGRRVRRCCAHRPGAGRPDVLPAGARVWAHADRARRGRRLGSGRSEMRRFSAAYVSCSSSSTSSWRARLMATVASLRRSRPKALPLRKVSMSSKT